MLKFEPQENFSTTGGKKKIRGEKILFRELLPVPEFWPKKGRRLDDSVQALKFLGTNFAQKKTSYFSEWELFYECLFENTTRRLGLPKLLACLILDKSIYF